MLLFKTYLFANFLMSVSGFVPIILHQDLNGLLKRFNINFVTIVLTDYYKLFPMAKNYRHLLKHCCPESNVGISIASSEAIASAGILPQGAVFLSAELTNNLTSLVLLSNENSPLFIFSLNETSIPDQFLRMKHIPYQSRAYVILRGNSNEKHLKMCEVYHVQEKKSGMVKNEVGKMVEENGKVVWKFDQDCDMLRRKNLDGAVIKVVYPWFMFAEFDPTGLGAAFRVSERCLFISISQLNLSTTATIMNDSDLIGEPNEQGHWSGVIGALQRRDGDITIVGINPAPIMEPVVDMSYPCGTTSYRLYFRAPAFTYSIATVLRGFTVSMWILCFMSLIAFSFTLYVASYVTFAENVDRGPRFDFSECLLTTLGDYCVKGWVRVPNSLPGRILCFCSVFVGYILNIYYVSQLQAGLTARTASIPFTDLDSLADTGTYGIILFGNSIPHEKAQHPTSGTMKRIHDLMEKHGNYLYTNFLEGMDRVCKENIALMGITAICDVVARMSSCQITNTNENVYVRTVSFPVQKGYVFNDIWGYYLRRCMEGGLFARKAVVSSDEANDSFVAIALVDVTPFLMIYVVTVGISLTMLIGEIIYSKVQLARAKVNKVDVSVS